ncbi:hypothetical protein RRG08_049100 [Elysia crispata]|uniref:Uncharacterized protein n=1 Tax=Elysia crispata TaxID=231223 RepID=A0AAE1B8B2_9GAST|nr:hypothetical protein RRG08_049100 [Elysia crispata]
MAASTSVTVPLILHAMESTAPVAQAVTRTGLDPPVIMLKKNKTGGPLSIALVYDKDGSFTNKDGDFA